MTRTAQADATLRDAAPDMLAALRPFSGHVGKAGSTITLRIGKDEWVGTLTTDDFIAASRAVAKALGIYPYDSRGQWIGPDGERPI